MILTTIIIEKHSVFNYCRRNNMSLKILTVVLFTITVVNTAYDNYKIYDVLPKSLADCDYLYELSKEFPEHFDFFALKKVPNEYTSVLVHPAGLANFTDLLLKNNIGFKLKVNNLADSLRDYEEPKATSGVGKLDTTRYYTHAEINEYLEDLVARYPTRVYTTNVGRTYEGRLLKTITVTNGDGVTGKKLIVVDGGMHAREWISPAQALYVIHQLVENYNENADLLKNTDWLILPAVNADGYDYSRSSRSTNMWRKTRRPYASCYGADPNRNFGYHWNENGASDEPCDDIYAGPRAFSEQETSVLRDILLGVRHRGIFYLTLHSFGKYLLYPWGYTEDLPDNWRDLDEVARAGADAIYDYSKSKYTCGSSTNTLYPAAGGSDDYAYSVGFPISITMELPSGGLSGFHPSTSKIDGIVTESWIGIRAMALKVIQKYT